jgi:hypothetical protein
MREGRACIRPRDSSCQTRSGTKASTSPASDPRAQALPDRPRRGKELVLLIAASVIVGFALLLVQLAQEQELSPALLWITLAFLAGCVALIAFIFRPGWRLRD